MPASLDDVVTQLSAGVRVQSKLVQTVMGLAQQSIGQFTWPAAVSTTITNANVTANSHISLSALNSAAGTLVGSNKSWYVSARVTGTSFTVSTASGVAASGTEQFSYLITNPL